MLMAARGGLHTAKAVATVLHNIIKLRLPDT